MRIQSLTFSAIASVAFLAITGCASVQKETESLLKRLPGISKKDELNMPKSGPTKVVTDASALALDLPEGDIQAREKFEQRFNKLIDEERNAAANLLVARHLDRAYESLTMAIPDGGESQLRLAAAYDRSCQSDDGWYAVMNSHDSETTKAYFNQRAQWLGVVSVGQFAETAEIDLVAAATASGRSALLVDAWYQTGVGALLREDNIVAANAFAACAQAAGNRHGMIAANAILMRSESLKRAGQFAESKTAWRDAVIVACGLLRTVGVSEPNFWDRASYLRPLELTWPEDVADSFEAVALGRSTPLRTDLLRRLGSVATRTTVSSDCWVQSAIGSWKQARSDNHNAIVHLKKAERNGTTSSIDWIQISQARSFVKMGQHGVATTVLAPIASRDDNAPTTIAAMAELGTVRLTNGSSQTGLRLLRQALDDHPDVEWPGRASAEADYALGLLMVGDESGLGRLTAAQDRFEAEGEIELLSKSLWNQMKYLEHTEIEKETVAELETRLDSMQL
ncbi:MAG: hypothetical protein AAGG48_16360 [Planctomycetota bacterium]